jgi:mannose-6-phosphate isomerase-like protein (cupin superfamily)
MYPKAILFSRVAVAPTGDAEMKNVINLRDVPKKIWKPPAPGDPEPIATLLDGQDLLTRDSDGAIEGSERLTMLVQNYRPGGFHKTHSHHDAEQVFFVYEGEGQFLLGEEWFDISRGDLVYVPRNTTHAARNTSDDTLTLIFISVPLGRSESR